MLKLLTALAVTLAGLPSCSTVSRVPVAVEPVTCDPGARPTPPRVHWEATDDNRVATSPDGALAMWEYLREDARWHERAQVCLDTRDSPLGLVTHTMRHTDPVVIGWTLDAGQHAVVAAMSFPGLDAHVVWEHCGFLGDGYTPGDHTVHLCYETAMIPALGRFAAAHEMAHALMRSLGKPILGNEEQQADDIAVVALILLGHADDVLEVAHGFNNAMGAVETVNWMDTHPSWKHRARAMRCLVIGSTGQDWLFHCRDEWRLRVRAFTLLFGDQR